MIFQVLFVEENLRIIKTEKNHRPSASNRKLSHIKFLEWARPEPKALAVRGKKVWDEDRRLRTLGHGGPPMKKKTLFFVLQANHFALW